MDKESGRGSGRNTRIEHNTFDFIQCHEDNTISAGKRGSIRGMRISTQEENFRR